MAPSSRVSDFRRMNASPVDTRQQQESDDTECTNTKKVGRGKTTGLSVAKKKKKSATGKLHVIIPEDKKVAVGPGAADFVTEIGVIIQKNAPLNFKKWKDIPMDAKDKIVIKVLDTFDIDDTKHNRDTILEQANRQYRSYRQRLHTYFERFETNDEALEHTPEDVSEDDWEFLVNYFSSDEYKAISERNKKNKAQQVINHRCGRKKFQAVSFDARDIETGKEPNFQDLWLMTHVNNNGEWVDEASREVYRNVEKASMVMLQDVDEETDKDSLINVAFQSVVGERSEYCRGLGAGIRPKGKTSTGLREQLDNEREKRKSLETKVNELEIQLQEGHKQREEMEKRREEMEKRFEESQRQLEERMERQLQERMETMFFRMQTSSAGRFVSAMNMSSELGHSVGTSVKRLRS